MNGNQTILIFFRLLNFAVIIGMAFYFWRRFGRAYFVSEYEKWQKYLSSLAQTHSLLRQKDRTIIKAYADDEQQRLELRERLFAWRDAVQKQEQALADEKDMRAQELQERMQIQSRRVKKYRLYRQIQKEAVNEAREKLRAEYSSPDAQEQIIESIMNRLDAA